jgi:hypothetical protein
MTGMPALLFAPPRVRSADRGYINRRRVLDTDPAPVGVIIVEGTG